MPTPRAGRTVDKKSVTANTGVKLESFIFDCFVLSDAMAVRLRIECIPSFCLAFEGGGRGSRGRARSFANTYAYLCGAAFTNAHAYCSPQTLEIKREEEFSPVKNAPGDAVDSPDSARRIVSELHRGWAVRDCGRYSFPVWAAHWTYAYLRTGGSLRRALPSAAPLTRSWRRVRRSKAGRGATRAPPPPRRSRRCSRMAARSCTPSCAAR